MWAWKQMAMPHSTSTLKAENHTFTDLPTPKSEKTGGEPKKTWRLSKKPGDFAKTSRDK